MGSFREEIGTALGKSFSALFSFCSFSNIISFGSRHGKIAGLSLFAGGIFARRSTPLWGCFMIYYYRRFFERVLQLVLLVASSTTIVHRLNLTCFTMLHIV
jgi:hypothetical protein